MPQGWIPEMSHFVRDVFLDREELASVKELFYAEYRDMGDKLVEDELWDTKELNAWFISLRPAEGS